MGELIDIINSQIAQIISMHSALPKGRQTLLAAGSPAAGYWKTQASIHYGLSDKLWQTAEMFAEGQVVGGQVEVGAAHSQAAHGAVGLGWFVKTGGSHIDSERSIVELAEVMRVVQRHDVGTTRGRSFLGVEMVAFALHQKARLSAEFAGGRKIQVWDWYMMGMLFVLDEVMAKKVFGTVQKNWWRGNVLKVTLSTGILTVFSEEML
jgi:hypothetical protein